MSHATKLPYDLIAIDLDGTLLDSSHAVPAANREALHRAHAAGLKIVLCTGRAFPETQPIIAQIGLDLDATVTVFGTLITDVASGRTLERACFAPADARTLAAWFMAREYAVIWLCDRDGPGHDGYIIDGRRRHAALDRWLGLTPCRFSRTASLAECVEPTIRLTIIDDAPLLEALAPDLTRDLGHRIRFNMLRAPAYDLIVLEAFPRHVSKWYGIERLCRRWSIDPRRTVAIGDDVNDIDMLQHAGLGVAMANGRPEARQAARRITVSNDEAGVARVIHDVLEGRA